MTFALREKRPRAEIDKGRLRYIIRGDGFAIF